jgi:hypothetical protein
VLTGQRVRFSLFPLVPGSLYHKSIPHKGCKSCVVHFPDCLASFLEQQLAFAKTVAAKDSERVFQLRFQVDDRRTP